MNQFDKSACAQLRREVNEALRPLMEKHGLTFDMGTMRFSTTEVRAKLTLGIKNTFRATPGGLVQVPVPNLGANDELVGRKFTFKGRTFQITEVNERRWKRPIIAKEMYGDSREFVFQKNVVVPNLLPV